MLLPSALRAQTDMTSKIQNADLSSNEGWTITCTEGQGWATQKGTAPYNVSEAYAGWDNLYLKEYSISQKIVLPKGAYELSGFAFYRYGVGYDVDPSISNAVLFAGEEEVSVATLGSIEGLGSYANSVDDASSQFSQGNYLNTLVFNVLADDTEVEIGFKGIHDLKQSWFICGPVKLVQTSTEPQVADLEELKTAYDEALAAAQAVEGKMSADARAALDAAIAAEVDATSADALKEATKALTSATNAAKTSISRFEGVAAYLAKMGGVLDLTNVYTPESFATYITDVKSAYDAGTMTDAEAGSYTANSAYSTVWHSANFIDDVLLSNWTIGGQAAAAYDTKLYINTWSVEGNSDGSNLLTPFFEYWTDDVNSLANNTLAAKVEGVAPGNYYVEVLARVRLKNNVEETPTGITMSVNGGDAVDLCAGEQSTNEKYLQMYYGTFTAEGVVGEDGVLNIEINIDGTNCSWIAYRDVKYMTAEEKLESDLAKAYEAAMASIKDGNFYQIYTLVGETPYYLTNTGTLTANEEEAYSFKMTTAVKSGTKYAKGWNTSVPFTNPTLTNGSTGDIKNDGSIHRNNSNRDDFERQVFFEQDGKYAVRATNGGGTNWGANTYWAQVGTDELPEAGYHLAPQYIWMLNDVTGVALLAEAKAIVEAKDNVGSGLFMKPEDAFATFEEAVDDAAHVIEDVTATSEEKDAAIAALQAAVEAYNNAPLNSPDPAQAYTFQQKASELFMGLSESGVSLALEENASELFFEAGENGGYFIHDAEGQYVGFDGKDNWTMSTSADKKYEWKVTLLGDNYYTLSKPSNGNHHVGTNDNDVAEGAPCYADKNNSDNSYYLWAIEEVEDEVEYETVDLTQADYHSWSAPDATGEITGDGYCVYEVGNSTGNIYGNPSVLASDYADLSDCGGLIVIASAGTPRFLFNQMVTNGSDFINIPNNAEQTAKYQTTLDNGDGTISYIINVPAIVADYGFCHLNAIKGANWQDVTVESIEVLRVKEEEPEAPVIEIAFERVAGKAYTGDDVPYDEAAILEALGAASWDEITTMYPMVMTTGEAGEDHDGWRNVDGDPAERNNEGTDLGLCLKYPHDGAFALCTHPGNDPVVGTEMSAAWILGTEAGKTVIVKVNVTFVEPEVIDLTIDKINKLDEVAVNFTSDAGAYYEGMTSDVDVAAILEKLGVESLSDVKIYAVKSDGTFDDNYKLGTSDGWRDANGDWKNWSNSVDTAPYYYVKADFSKADTQIYDVGGYPGHTDEAATFTATYVFVKDGTADAVVLNVNLTYVAPLDPDLVEIPQDQGTSLDDFARTALEEGEDFNTYTASADLQVAFKMYDIDVTNCDYVVVKFAEPVPAGWCIAFWAQGGTDNVEIPAGSTEYKYVFADDPKCAIENDILPQICVLTLWGAEKPLVMKVTGVYKHQNGEFNAISGINSNWNDGKVHKVLRDGKIVIIKGDKEYNVTGAAIK